MTNELETGKVVQVVKRGRKKKDTSDPAPVTVINMYAPLPIVMNPTTESAPIKQKRVFSYEKLSASMMKTWMLCKRKFHLNYIDGIDQESNTSFTLGTACHHALEQANKSLKANPRQLNPFEIEEYVQIFRDEAAKLHITDMSLFSDGEEIIKDELNSYDSREKILGIEDEFRLTTPEGVTIYGFMDKVTEVDSSTIKIIDYKTSNQPMSFEESKTDAQLSMYDLAVSMKYPKYERRILELRYIKTRDVIRAERSDVEQHNFRRQIFAINKAIIDYTTKAKENNIAPEGELNEFCSWCSFKHACPKYVAQVGRMLPEAPTTAGLTSETFVGAWEKVNHLGKLVDEWKDSLKLWVAQQMEGNPEIVISDGKKQIYSVSATRREYDVSTVGKLIGLDGLLGASTGGEPLVKLTNKKLEEFLKVKDDPKLQEKVEQAVTIKFNSPMIKVKKVQG